MGALVHVEPAAWVVPEAHDKSRQKKEKTNERGDAYEPGEEEGDFETGGIVGNTERRREESNRKGAWQDEEDACTYRMARGQPAEGRKIKIVVPIPQATPRRDSPVAVY